MASRVQVGDLAVGQTPIQPTAAPVNVFVQPAQPSSQPNSLTELAQALQSVQPALANFGNTMQQSDNVKAQLQLQKDKAAGAVAYFKTKVAWKDAVSKGLIQPGQSPAFQQAYQESELSQKAYTYSDQLHAAYLDAHLDQSTDPEAVNKFVSDFTAKYTADNGLDGYDPTVVAASFLPEMQRAQYVLHEQYTADRAKFVEQGLSDNTEQTIGRIVEDVNKAQLPVSAMGPQIGALLTHVVAAGMDGKKANKLGVDAIVNYATEHNDTSVLDALDSIPTGNGGFLGRTAYARDQVLQAHTAITNKMLAQEARADRLQAKAEAAQRKHFIGAGFAAVIADPNTDITKLAQGIADSGDGQTAAALLAFQQTRQAAAVKVNEDPGMMAHIYDQMKTAEDDAERQAIIMQHANAGDISPSTVQDLNRYSGDLGRNKDVYEQDWYKSIVGGYQKTITGGALNFDGTAGLKALKFGQAIDQDVADWIKHNSRPDGSYDRSALRAYMQKASDILLPSYSDIAPDTIKGLTAPSAAPDWAQ